MLMRTRQKVYAVTAVESLRRRGKEARLPVEFTSEFGEELMIRYLLGGRVEKNYYFIRDDQAAIFARIKWMNL